MRLRRSYQIFYLPIVLKIDLFVRGVEPFDILGILRVAAAIDRAYLAEWAEHLKVHDLLVQALRQA